MNAVPVEDELGQERVAVEQVRVRLAANLVLSGAVPVEGPHELRRQSALYFVDVVVVLLEERVEHAVPVGADRLLDDVCL
jgi:hypothetical protein